MRVDKKYDVLLRQRCAEPWTLAYVYQLLMLQKLADVAGVC